MMAGPPLPAGGAPSALPRPRASSLASSFCSGAPSGPRSSSGSAENIMLSMQQPVAPPASDNSGERPFALFPSGIRPPLPKPSVGSTPVLEGAASLEDEDRSPGSQPALSYR